jgi:hypothetical protein
MFIFKHFSENVWIPAVELLESIEVAIGRLRILWARF